MSNTRLGCYYCFKVLDPQDTNKKLRTFVKCSQCDNVYHVECWQKSENCSKCNSNGSQPIKLAPLSRLRTTSKTRTVSVKPSIIVTEDGTELNQGSLWKFLGQNILCLLQVVRAVVVAVFLLAIAIFIGVFIYRIIQLNPINAETVMNAIFRESLPPTNVFVGAFISGGIFALVFYSRPHSSASKNDGGTGQFTYFLGGIITIIGLDILLFNFTVRDLVNLNININMHSYEEILYAQGATALIVMLLTPLHKSLASLTISPEVKLTPFIRSLYGWTRFLLVSLLLNLFVVYLSTLGLPRSLNVPKLSNISLEFMDITLALPMVGAFATGLAVASIFYWPPKFRQLKSRFGILRLLLVILCVISIGYMYRIPPNPEVYLNTLVIACIATFLAIPVQRSLS